MSSVKLSEVDDLIGKINSLMEKCGPSIYLTGAVKIDDLGIQLGFNNFDCHGACNTSCSGCSACSGCSGCSTTSTSTSTTHPQVAAEASPLKDPRVRNAIAGALREDR